MPHEAEVQSALGKYETLAVYAAPDAFAILGVTEARLRWSVQGHVDPWLLAVARRIVTLRGADGDSADLETGHLVLSALAYAVRRYGGAPAGDLAKGGLTGRQMKRVLDVMESELGEALTIGRLAREASLSEYYFVRAFTRSAGATPYRYLTMLRLERAKKLLTTSRRSVQDVAIHCGFGEAGSLVRAFKSHVGMRPTEYRQANARARGAGFRMPDDPLRLRLGQI